MKHINRIITLVFLIGNLIAVFLLLGSVLAANISPAVWVYPAFLAIAFPIWVFLNLFFLLFWILRWNKWAFLPLTALLLCYSPITNYFPLHRKTRHVPESAIKLLTYNSMTFRDAIKNRKSENNILNYLQRSEADIICLQEYQFQNGKPWFTENYIKNKLSAYPYYKYVPHKSRYHGIACFSKYPITQVEEIHYESIYNQSAAFTIRLNDDREVIVINNHLESNGLDSEDKLSYKKAMSRLDIDFFFKMDNTLFKKMINSYKLRAVQADSVRSYINRQDKSIIVCGDFNDTPGSYVYSKIRGNLKDAFGSTGLGMGVTFNRDRFYFRIDHILYSRSLKAYNCEIDQVYYSDHYPVSCFFDFK